MKKKISICFIVLHYVDINLTRRTVDSILGLDDNQNIQIVIVDNASFDGSGNSLKRIYKNSDKVQIIISKTNGGFSAGNNLGYKFCLNNYDADFVIAVNNDVIFSQKEFIPLLYDCYERDRFFVAGPDIFIPHRQYHQSPMALKLRTDEDMCKAIRRIEIREEQYVKKFSLKMYRRYLTEILRDNEVLVKVIEILRKIKPQKDINWEKQISGAVLQGACIIFSNDYCLLNNELFEPLTFMYGEEDFLALRCAEKGWKVEYIPQLRVLHTNQGSSGLDRMSYREYCNKKMISDRKCAESYKLYIEKYKKEHYKKRII